MASSTLTEARGVTLMSLIAVAITRTVSCLQGRSHYAMTKLVDDVVGVIRHLGYSKCVLVGHGERPGDHVPVES